MTIGAKQTRRGGKPAGTALSRDAILATALDLVRRDGFDALTLRALAAALGVGAMSLYTYFRGRDELVAALLGELIETIPSPPGAADQPDWRDDLRSLAHAHRDLLRRYPSAIPYFLSTPIAGQKAARFGEDALSALHRGGYSGEAAVGVFFALMALNYGFVSFETQRRRPHLTEDEREEAARGRQALLASLSTRHFPLTVAAAAHLARFTADDDQYDFALNLLLGQPEATPPAALPAAGLPDQ